MLEGERVVEVKIQGVQEWGDHLLQVDDASCAEHMSSPYACALTVLSDLADDLAQTLPEMIGRHAILRVEVVSGLYRYFSGIVTSFTQTGVQDARTVYAMEMAPWLWLLGHRRNYRIFQFEDVPAILATIFKEWLDDLGDARAFRVDDRAKGPFTVRDYCVQYDETDLEFVERLMQEEGIAYFFVHDADGHELVLVDDPGQHQDFKLEAPLRLALSGEEDVDSITSLVLDQDSLPTAHVVSDRHFERPHKAHTDASVSTALFGRALHEVLHHPAGHAEPFVGKEQDGSTRLGDIPALAKRLGDLRLEGAECEMIRARGGSHSPLLTPGHLMTVTPEPGDFDTGAARGYYRRTEGQYLVVGVSHQISGGGHRDASSFSYANTFEALPQKVPFVEKLGLPQPLAFRPPRLAQKPRARGPETALVVGPKPDSTEEIWTDKYGRVLVRFFWDRRTDPDKSASCWIRVAQPWAGNRWGAVFIPRIGQEVIVDFLGGDPDRPIITGSVYNADQMPPYELPANRTQSGIKTRSSKGGGSANFNELRFEDKTGEEEVYLHAERNHTTVVENDESRSVGHDRTTTIGHDDKLTVQNARTADIVDGADTLTVHTGNRDVTVSTGKALLTVSKNNREVSVPLATYKLDAKIVEVTGVQEIKLAVGANSIKIDQSGITIFGTLVKIN